MCPKLSVVPTSEPTAFTRRLPGRGRLIGVACLSFVLGAIRSNTFSRRSVQVALELTDVMWYTGKRYAVHPGSSNQNIAITAFIFDCALQSI